MIANTYMFVVGWDWNDQQEALCVYVIPILMGVAEIGPFFTGETFLRAESSWGFFRVLGLQITIRD